MGWQFHQLDHVQIICTSLQTYNHVSTLPPWLNINWSVVIRHDAMLQRAEAAQWPHRYQWLLPSTPATANTIQPAMNRTCILVAVAGWILIMVHMYQPLSKLHYDLLCFHLLLTAACNCMPFYSFAFIYIVFEQQNTSERLGLDDLISALQQNGCSSSCCICTGYATKHTWYLSQARINWEGCGRKGI